MQREGCTHSVHHSWIHFSPSCCTWILGPISGPKCKCAPGQMHHHLKLERHYAELLQCRLPFNTVDDLGQTIGKLQFCIAVFEQEGIVLQLFMDGRYVIYVDAVYTTNMPELGAVAALQDGYSCFGCPVRIWSGLLVRWHALPWCGGLKPPQTMPLRMQSEQLQLWNVPLILAS